MTNGTVTVAGHTIALSHLEKLYWPDEGISKSAFLHYFTQIAPALLPHLYNRPLTVVRYPDGVKNHGFYQKDAPPHTPDWVKTYPVHSGKGKGHISYILANDLPTLIWLANQGAIEYHPWMSRTERPDYPDYAVIDLDPTEGADFDIVRTVARLTKTWLDRLGLEGVPKTSGATGIHVHIPLEPIYSYDVTHRFVGMMAHIMQKERPEIITTERMVKNRPPGTVYVDHLQNLPGKTIVAPYSPRPRPGAPVSAPFCWNELASMQPDQFHILAPTRVLGWARAYNEAMSQRQRLEQAFAILRSHI